MARKGRLIVMHSAAIVAFAFGTSSAEAQPETILEQAHLELGPRFGIGEPLGPLTANPGNPVAHRLYRGPHGPIGLEVHLDDGLMSVWAAIPHPGIDGGPIPGVTLWYQYVPDPAGRSLVFVPSPLMEIPPYPPPPIPSAELYHLAATYRWSHRSEYGGVRSGLLPASDPPHWSPILQGNRFGLPDVGRDPYRQIHQGMQELATQADAIRLLDAAAPPDGVDLTDRVRGDDWTTVTLRGLVRAAKVTEGDFARDHTTGYVRFDDGGWRAPFDPHGFYESSDRTWPGQDWDMKVIPDPDLHYLGSWNRARTDFELNVEIEQFAFDPPRLGDIITNPSDRFVLDFLTLSDHVIGPIDLDPSSMPMVWLRNHGYEEASFRVLDFLATLTEPNLPYHPQADEWVQIIGRWIADCGHGAEAGEIRGRDASGAYGREADRLGRYDPDVVEHYTEMHPPEMYVTTRPMGDLGSESWVAVTGAWQGYPLQFVVVPPPRPRADAVLRHRVRTADGSDGYDIRIGTAEPDLQEWPPTSPNHLVGTIRPENHSPVVHYLTGMVGMTAERRLRCVVDCWWELPTSNSTVLGRVTTADGAPAVGAALHHRDPLDPTSRWSTRALDERGAFHIDLLRSGFHQFRPAGPDWDFADVPRELDLPPAPLEVNFVATPRGTDRPEWLGPPPSPSDLPVQVYPELTRLLLSSDVSPGRDLGVRGNDLGYEEGGTLLVHLAGLAKWDDGVTPIARSEESFIDTEEGGPGLPSVPRGVREARGFPRYIIGGTPTRGVPRATIRAELLLHLREGIVVADTQRIRSDEAGVARFEFRTGTHAERVSLAYAIEDNPFNPWFRPADESGMISILPGAAGDDSAPSRLPTFRRSLGSPGLGRYIDWLGVRLDPPRRPPPDRRPIDRKVPAPIQVKLTPQEEEFLAEIREKRAEQSIPAEMLRQPGIFKEPVPAPAARAAEPMHSRLPPDIEEALKLARDPRRARELLIRSSTSKRASQPPNR